MCSSYSSHVLHLQKTLWWKLFRALEAWIHRASPICGFLKFLEAFELDSNKLCDLGRWFGWFLFKCSLYLKVEVVEGFEAWFLQSFCTSEWFWIFFDASWSVDVLVCGNALGLLLFIRVWGWVSDTWQSLISDICHSLIRGALRLFLQDTWHHLIGWNVLIFKVTRVNNWLDRLCHCLQVSDVIAYTCCCVACVVAYTSWCVIGILLAFFLCFYFMTLDKFLLVPEWWW